MHGYLDDVGSESIVPAYQGRRRYNTFISGTADQMTSVRYEVLKGAHDPSFRRVTLDEKSGTG